MNKNRLLQRWHIGCTLLAALFMVSCSQDEALEQGTALPEGKYPLELTASIGEATATPATRGTVHGEWPYNGYLKIASSIEYPNGVNWEELFSQGYDIDANGGVAFRDKYDNPTTIYWRRSDEKLYIYAGSTTLGMEDRLPWEVQSDQSSENNLNQSDYLAAYEVLTFGGEHKLTFRHLTSKITINIKESDYLTAHKDDVSVALVTKGSEKWYTKGNFKGDVSDITLFAEGDNLQQTEQITPYRNDNLQTAGIYATYEAVLIPQQITDTGKAIRIKVGDATYSYTLECSKDKFSSGEEWTYDITVNEESLDVTVSNSMGWDTTNGATGDGSVTLPEEIDLNDSNPVNITGDGTYLITGTGTQTVTISGDANVTFSNVNITAESPVKVTGGSPTLNFRGDNYLDCIEQRGGGISVENGANITLKGDTEDAVLTIKNSHEITGNDCTTVGIGCATEDGTCGNITISNLSLKINSFSGSGIGSMPRTTCGDIAITDCKLDIATVENAACIGASTGHIITRSQCGNITLRNCEIEELYAGESSGFSYSPAAIGCSSANANCKDINIYLRDNETIEQFLGKLTVTGDVDKVGVGEEMDGGPSIGTVTWYNHAGEKIGEGTRK